MHVRPCRPSPARHRSSQLSVVEEEPNRLIRASCAGTPGAPHSKASESPCAAVQGPRGGMLPFGRNNVSNGASPQLKLRGIATPDETVSAAHRAAKSGIGIVAMKTQAGGTVRP